MQHITLPNAFRSTWLAFAITVTLLLLSLNPQGSFFSQAQAQAQTNTLMQCAAPQPSSGCASCGCASCGCGGDITIPHCPAGYSSYDDFCLPDCPQDFIRYPGLPGLCMPPVHYGCGPGYDQVPLPQCPQGYYRDLRNPDLCVADIDYGLHQGVCPQGMAWSYDHGRCEADCPQGTYRDGRGLCQSYYSQESQKILCTIRQVANACHPAYGRPITLGCVCQPARPAHCATFVTQHCACHHRHPAHKDLTMLVAAAYRFATKVCNVTPMVIVCQSLAPMVAIQIYVANASSPNAQKVHAEMTEANACHRPTSATRAKRASMDSARPFAELARRVMPKAIALQINQTARKASA